MGDMLAVQIKDPGIALTDKERKLIDCLVMRVCVHHLHRRVSKPFRIRRARVDSIHLLVNHSVFVEGGITSDEADQIVSDLKRDIRQTLEMCDVPTDDVVLIVKD